MSVTHRDLLFWTRSRCFACKNHRWGLGPIDTSNSCAKDAALHAQNHSWGLEPQQTCKSGHKVAVLHEKNTDEVFDPQRLVILVLKALFYMHRTTGDGWKQYSLVILVQITLFCIQKHRCGLGPMQTCKSGPKVTVLHAKTTDEGWDP